MDHCCNIEIKLLVTQYKTRPEGKNKNIAHKNAEKIAYKYIIKEKTIELDGYFLSGEENLNKNESIFVTLSIPANTHLFFSRSTNSFIGDIETMQDLYSNDMPNHHFKMSPVGLECTDCDERLFKN